MVTTSNDREFNCDDRGAPIIGDRLNQVNIDAKVLDVDELRRDLERMATTLARSVDEYKQWLTSREAEFELRFLANDFTRDVALFNKLNGVVSRVRQARKRLNGWYSHIQELLANALDLLGSYSESATLVRTYGEADFTTINAGISFISPIAFAKRNVSKVRGLQRHLNTLALTETRLKTAIVNLRTQMEAFARGVVRNDGKLLDLAEVGKIVSELTDDNTPLLRVQQRLAAAINSTQLNVNVRSDIDRSLFATYNPTSSAPSESFLNNIRNVDPESADSLLSRLREFSESALYTDHTKEAIESIARLAQSRINEQDIFRRSQLDELIDTIRSNTPEAVVNRYAQQARNSDGVFLRVKSLRLIIANLHPDDRAAYETTFNQIYGETVEEAERTIDLRIASENNVNVDGDGDVVFRDERE